MCHKLIEDAKLFHILQRFDEDLADKIQKAGCPFCGGRLDRANYPRKSRGGPDGHDKRLSLCCAVQGCRSRATPPSVRFLGRKVYLSAIVVLATAMQQGETPKRLLYLRDLLGISRRTLRRWRTWWREVFGQSPFWQVARSRLARPLDSDGLPRNLLEAMGGEMDKPGVLIRLLRFISPITTRPHLHSLPI